MGLCTSKPSPSSHPTSSPKSNPQHANERSVSLPNGSDNVENPRHDKTKAENVKKSPFFPFYSPSPRHYFFSKKSPARSPANVNSTTTPKRFFKRPFLPPSLATHIKAVLARRHGSVKPNEAAIPEGSEAEYVTRLDKSFGFSKHLANKYEMGEEVGRGNFGYTCKATFKKGEFKGQQAAVKSSPKPGFAIFKFIEFTDQLSCKLLGLRWNR